MQFRYSEVPPELWSRIFKSIDSLQQLKLISTSCTLFQKVARSILWMHPIFTKKIKYEDLTQMAAWKLPIKSLQLSSLRYENSTTVEQFDAFVQLLLSKFHLTSFELVTGHACVTDTIFRIFLKLPVTKINTLIFSSNTPVKNIVTLLHEANQCKSIVYSPRFHSELRIQDWRKLMHLPITAIYACFNGNITDEQYFEQYNDIISKCAQTINFEYIIGDYHNYPLLPDHLLGLDKVRITKINVGKFSPAYQVKDYTDALIKNNQTPTIIIPKDSSTNLRLSAQDLEHLFQFRIAEIHISLLQVNHTDSTMHRIVELILLKHSQDPIAKFVLDRRRNYMHLSSAHLRRLRDAGLIPDNPHAFYYGKMNLIEYHSS